ncbi:MAG TPA: hypothetical protein VMR31_08990 [Myxococcota bacterium]|nr:hypothetical protein [Myxococcota bacterium]
MIGRIVRGLVIVVALIAVAIGGLFAAARFHDGPLGPIPGGPLAAGELVAQLPSDWSFAAGAKEVQMQLAYENTSRTTWILVDKGTAYIPCNLGFPPGKRWYKAADADGAAIVRVDGKRYGVTLSRVKDDDQIKSLGQVALAKYPEAASARGGTVWFFKLEPRATPG